MSDIEAIFEAIRTTEGCTVYPASGLPVIREEHSLPNDLVEFYSLCGGLDLFSASHFPVRIVRPEAFVLANPKIIGVWSEAEMREASSDDISWSWYIVAEGDNNQYMTIDLSPERLGRCYDSFWDIHPQNSTIIAMSFNELLRRLFANHGDHYYWLEPDFETLGDAYP